MVRKTATSARPTTEHRVPFLTDQGHAVGGTRRPAPAHMRATLHRPAENAHADPVPNLVMSNQPAANIFSLMGCRLAHQQIAAVLAALLQDPTTTTGWNTP